MTMLFVNLPVRDVRTAAAFWAELGFSANPQAHQAGADQQLSNATA